MNHLSSDFVDTSSIGTTGIEEYDGGSVFMEVWPEVG